MSKHDKKEEKRKNKKKKRIGIKIFLLILVIIAIFGAIFAKRVYDLDGNWLAAIMGHNKTTLQNLDKISILIMGESEGMSDTMIVCSYNPKTQEASMLSIPRDTFTGDSTSNAKSSDKLNSLYSNGTKPEKTLAAINEITGLNIKNYILIDTKALKELVDAIDGIEFNVPIDMEYGDYSQNLFIDLKAGLQKLDGSKVEQLVRFRHNNDGSTYPYEYGMEDYGRMRTQRELIKVVASQTIKLSNVTKATQMLDILKKYVQTNMDFNQFKDYIPYAINLNMDSIKTEQLPGESKVLNGIWFFLPDDEKTPEVIQSLFPN